VYYFIILLYNSMSVKYEDINATSLLYKMPIQVLTYFVFLLMASFCAFLARLSTHYVSRLIS